MKHFTMAELTRSATALAKGLDNTPKPAHRRNLEELVAHLLDPLREAWAVRCAHEQLGTPAIRITSGYRGFRLNEAVGGAAASAHCFGLAADLVPINGQLAEFKRFCREWLAKHPFDQMISESEDTSGIPRWIHVGYKNRQGGQRRQMLSMRSGRYQPMTA